MLGICPGVLSLHWESSSGKSWDFWCCCALSLALREASLRPRDSWKSCRLLPKTLQTATELYPSFPASCKCNRIRSCISETCPEQSDHCSPVAWVGWASYWLEEKGCFREYKEEAVVALSSWVPGVRLANVEPSRICFGSAHSRMVFISCLSCSMARVDSCSALCCQWDCICDKPTYSFLIVSLVGWDGICLFVCLNKDHQFGLFSDLCQSNKGSLRQLEVDLTLGPGETGNAEWRSNNISSSDCGGAILFPMYFNKFTSLSDRRTEASEIYNLSAGRII